MALAVRDSPLPSQASVHKTGVTDQGLAGAGAGTLFIAEGLETRKQMGRRREGCCAVEVGSTGLSSCPAV